MGNRITKNLVSQSLFKAVAAKRPGPGLIHHSDRGSQYCAHEYRRLVDQFKMRASMSRKGDCYDNAPMESFWGTLKNELIHHRRYKTREQAIREITEYIEVFYNRQRRQARLGYLSPAVYEGSSMQGRLQHEECFVSTIDIRGQFYEKSLFNIRKDKGNPPP